MKRTLIIGALDIEEHIIKYRKDHPDEKVYTLDNRPNEKASFHLDFNDEFSCWTFLKEKEEKFDSIIFDFSVGKDVTLDDEVLFNTYLYDILKEGGSIYFYDDIAIQPNIRKEAWVKLFNKNLVRVYCKKLPYNSREKYEGEEVFDIDHYGSYSFIKQYKCNCIYKGGARTGDEFLLYQNNNDYKKINTMPRLEEFIEINNRINKMYMTTFSEK
jgi:hypothetical protein